jgi:hypothetical protein
MPADRSGQGRRSKATVWTTVVPHTIERGKRRVADGLFPPNKEV